MKNYLCENYKECQSDDEKCWHSHPHESSPGCYPGFCDKDGKFCCYEIILKKEDKKDERQ